jgi:hypothetical protein
MLEEFDVTDASEVDSVESFLVTEGVVRLGLDLLLPSLDLSLESVLLVFGFSTITELLLFGWEDLLFNDAVMVDEEAMDFAATRVPQELLLSSFSFRNEMDAEASDADEELVRLPREVDKDGWRFWLLVLREDTLSCFCFISSHSVEKSGELFVLAAGFFFVSAEEVCDGFDDEDKTG